MRVLAAGAALKGTIDCVTAAIALQEGAAAAGANAEALPIADGGDGSLLALKGAGFSLHPANCSDALGRPVQGLLGWHADSRTAVVEFAQAAGISRLGAAPGDPWDRSSRGVGELMRRALDLQPDILLVLLGGSATQDAGIGLLHGLGARLEGVDAALPAARDLLDLRAIDLSPALSNLSAIRLLVGADVAHALHGAHGSALSFAGQKGFAPGDIALLDQAIAHAGAVLASESGRDLDLPGAGAAGGAGAALLALGAQMHLGAELILDLLNFDDALGRADLLLTTEGQADGTTWAGKAPAAAASRALRRGIPAVLIAGSVGDGAEAGPPGLEVVTAASGSAASPADIARTARAAVERRLVTP